MFLVLETVGSEQHAEGELVPPETAVVLVSRGIACLPVVPELLHRNGVGGFYRRAFAGQRLSNVPARCCPMVMFCDPRYQTIHWRARLRLSPGAAMPPDGQVRVVPDAYQEQVSNVGLSTVTSNQNIVRLNGLGPEDARGGWTVGGWANCRTDGPQYVGLALYGHGPGVLVDWVACSLAP